MAVDLVFDTFDQRSQRAAVATGWLLGRLSERGRSLARELGARNLEALVDGPFDWQPGWLDRARL
jgi:hypothetical protein